MQDVLQVVQFAAIKKSCDAYASSIYLFHLSFIFFSQLNMESYILNKIAFAKTILSAKAFKQI